LVKATQHSIHGYLTLAKLAALFLFFLVERHDVSVGDSLVARVIIKTHAM